MDEPKEIDKPEDEEISNTKCIFCDSESFVKTIRKNGICSHCLDKLRKTILGNSYEKDDLMKTLLKTKEWEKTKERIMKETKAETIKEINKSMRR